MKHFSIHTSIALGLGLSLALALLVLLGGRSTPATAAPACRPQAPGDVITVCLSGACDYSSIQDAVDAASDGDIVKIATGIYTGVQGRLAPPGYYGPSVITQVVYISKTITIRGGYTSAFGEPPDPNVNPTTLDAQGQGRVLFIAGNISPTIEGLRITGGSAAGLWGSVILNSDVGGGVYAINASPTIRHNQVFSNTHGGLFLCQCSNATLAGNVISGNNAGRGGGISLDQCINIMLDGNTVSGNTAGGGGGVALTNSSAMLNGNTISGNTALGGGGLYLDRSTATVNGNVIASNTAEDYEGGGVALSYSSLTLNDSTIFDNTADNAGGGLFWGDNCTVTLSRNSIISNSVNGNGGGVYGGMMASGMYSSTFINNVIADNHAGGVGSGLYLGSPSHLMHTTLARNHGGDGSGVYVASSVTMTNTILVSHTVGITVTVTAAPTGRVTNTATLEGTLWGNGAWANGSDWGGSGIIVTGTHNTWGDPTFVNPNAGDYHIGPGSAAIDQGVDTGVYVDIDGDPRPMGSGFDLGADELGASLVITKRADLSRVEAGAPLTYTIQVTNTGVVSLTTVITDVLPAHVTPTGVLTWTALITAPGGVWTQPVVVTVETGYAGPLVNVVQVTSKEGAVGVYTHTLVPALEVTKQAGPDPVQAGGRLTYTIYVTNTGNYDLHASITDTLPAHVTPGGVFTWTALIAAPDGVWVQTLPVTVEMGYAGTLTNEVEVTTDEGASGVYTETTLSLASHLEVTKQAAPDPVQAGAPLIYTIRVTNTGNVDLHAVITDTLPAHVAPTGTHVWTALITAPGGVWVQTLPVIVEMGYAGTLTNEVEVTTDEGATGVYSETSLAQVTPALAVTKQADPDPVQAGTPLTCTIRVTNTGNVTLHATITDTLPAHVAPTGVLTWTAFIAAPGGVWVQTLPVTVEVGYAGILTNEVEVTTEEGAAGEAAITVNAICYKIYLPLVLRNSQ